MKKKNYKALLRYIAEEKAYIRFKQDITYRDENDYLDFENPDVRRYISLEIRQLREVFEMYDCAPRESYVEYLIRKIKIK